jgi:hypothetical protein
MCAPSIATFLDPIGTISKSIAGKSSIAGWLTDPVGGAQRAVGGAVGGVPGAFLDPGRIATAVGSSMDPQQPQQSTGGANVIDGGGPGAPSAVYQPSANTYAQGSGQDGALNTYVLGMNKARQGAGDVYMAGVGEDVLGPFNQGGQKAVKKVAMQ